MADRLVFSNSKQMNPSIPPKVSVITSTIDGYLDGKSSCASSIEYENIKLVTATLMRLGSLASLLSSCK